MYLKNESHIKCTMNKGLFYWAILSIASIAVIFQTVALFAPAWFRLHAEFRDKGQKWNVVEEQGQGAGGGGGEGGGGRVSLPSASRFIDIDLGLWTIRGCVNSSCHTANLYQLRDYMELETSDTAAQVQNRFLDNFTLMQGLAIAGALSTIAGFISLLITSRWDTGRQAKCRGFTTTILWALTGILLLVTVAHRKNENTSLEKEMVAAKLDVYFNYPWAIPLYGVSGFLSITLSLILLCKLLVVDISGSTPGSWIQIGEA